MQKSIILVISLRQFEPWEVGLIANKASHTSNKLTIQVPNILVSPPTGGFNPQLPNIITKEYLQQRL